MRKASSQPQYRRVRKKLRSTKAYDAFSSWVSSAKGVSLSGGAAPGPGGARSRSASAAGSSLPRGNGHGIATDPAAEPHQRLAHLGAKGSSPPNGGPLPTAVGSHQRLALGDLREPELDVLHLG